MSDVEKKTSRFPIIGIGASAGGIESFKKLLGAMPSEMGVAFVVIQHLAPDHDSALADILSRVTSLPVWEITDGLLIQPDHVYVLPENTTLEMKGHRLILHKRPKDKQHMPVDLFFTSLATEHESAAVGIVLSGTHRDGTVGLGAIRQNGGIAIAEDPEQAAWDGMPQSAIDAGVVDFVLPAEDIPGKIRQVLDPYEPVSRDQGKAWLSKNKDGLKKVIGIIHQHSGVDFSYYKKPTLIRRLERRMAINQSRSHTDYIRLLRESRTEQEALFQDFLIKVTAFYRDPQIFLKLSEEVFPKIIADKQKDDPIRIWVVGCATGEEVYSLAICLLDVMGGPEVALHPNSRQVQFFTSDVSEVAIKKAREGSYSASEVEPLSELQLQTYFTKTDGNYKIIKPLRDCVVFATHNFLKDPPFGNVDLVSCRNVFIYMDQFLQRKALITFHYALRDNGYLLLGQSETTGLPPELFVPYSKQHKIFTRRPGSGRFEHVIHSRWKKQAIVPGKRQPVPKPPTDFRKSAEAMLLSRYTPAGVVINEHMEVVHILGKIAPFLEPPSGTPNFELMKMARKELAFELRNAIHKARAKQQLIKKKNIPMAVQGERFWVTIEVSPLQDVVDPHYVVVFKRKAESRRLLGGFRKGLKSLWPKSDSHPLTERNEALKNELEQAREDMRHITEAQETQNEELQSANEELQSANEEMQSLNEELETSKEELQSTNEELVVVNRELIEKQDELQGNINFTEGIIATLREPFVVLTQDLRVQRINSAYRRKFDVDEPEVVGKMFFDIQNHYWNLDELSRLLQHVLYEKEQLVNHEIVIHSSSEGEQIYCLNAREVVRTGDHDRLLLLSIEDITRRREIERKHLETIGQLNQANEHLDQFVHVASHDLQEPLRKIMTFSSRLLSKGKSMLTPDMVTQLDKILSSSSRMSALLNNLLSYSQLANADKHFEPVPLNEILQGVVTDLELIIEQKQARMEIEDLPIVEGISHQISQLFYNLINNALKFSRKDIPPLVSVTSRPYPVEKVKEAEFLDVSMDYVEILVRDNGIGFSPAYAEQIFTIFQRLHGTGEYQGTGIGLALCKRIAENHHGIIFAHSGEGKGAKFHIVLPLVQQVKYKKVRTTTAAE